MRNYSFNNNKLAKLFSPILKRGFISTGPDILKACSFDFNEHGRKCFRLMEAQNIPPVLVCRAMKAGHFAVFRFIGLFDKNDTRERRLTRKINEKIYEIFMEHGYIPYKIPRWAWEKLKKVVPEDTLLLMQAIKHTPGGQLPFNPMNLNVEPTKEEKID